MFVAEKVLLLLVTSLSAYVMDFLLDEMVWRKTIDTMLLCLAIDI